jgi:hypothetical protein
VEADDSQTRGPYYPFRAITLGCHRDSALLTPDADFRSCQRFHQEILWLVAKRAVSSRHYLAEVWRTRRGMAKSVKLVPQPAIRSVCGAAASGTPGKAV